MSGVAVVPTTLPGCVELRPPAFGDARGRLVKVFHEGLFAERGLETRFREQYVSTSQRHVLRGLHFQVPPFDHVKLVYCLHGAVLDVAVDLRRGSPTYGQAAIVELSAAGGNGVYLPRGLAHGFYALTDDATISCQTSTVYAPAHDAGIRWDSVGVAWPGDAPLLSERDRALPALADFDSPFAYEAPPCPQPPPPSSDAR